jgi:DNA polymerase V
VSASQPPRPAHARETSGFPSPAADSAEASLDVRDLLVRRPAATFYLRMRGDARIASGVFAGDILVVDRSLTPAPGALVIVAADGALRLTRWRPQPSPAGDESEDSSAATLWGVVTYLIHKADALAGDPIADALDIE